MNWKSAYLETRILSANPLELVAILYEHAIEATRDAIESLAAGDVETRCKRISKAIAILSELEGSLDLNAGAEIAQNLSRLYSYMRDQLTLANLQRSAQMLDDVARLLETIYEAWRTIAATPAWEQTTGLPNGLSPSVFGEMPPDLSLMVSA